MTFLFKRKAIPKEFTAIPDEESQKCSINDILEPNKPDPETPTPKPEQTKPIFPISSGSHGLSLLRRLTQKFQNKSTITPRNLGQKKRNDDNDDSILKSPGLPIGTKALGFHQNESRVEDFSFYGQKASSEMGNFKKETNSKTLDAESESFNIGETKVKVIVVPKNKALFKVGRKEKLYCDESLYLFTSTSQLRVICVYLQAHWLFKAIMYFCIPIEFFVIARLDFNSEENKEDSGNPFLSLSSHYLIINIIEAIFIAEMLVAAISRGVWSDGKSVIRQSHLLFSLLGTIGFVTCLIRTRFIAFSTLRTFRLCKLAIKLKFFKYLKTMIQVLRETFIEITLLLCVLSTIIFLFSIIGLNLWSGTLNYRCRVTEEPENGDWVLLPDYEHLCGAYQCPEGSFCGSNYDFPDSFPDDYDLAAAREALLGFYSFDNIYSSLLTNCAMVLVDNWYFLNNKIREGYGSIATTLYFVGLIFMSSFFLNNFIIAVKLDYLLKISMEKQKKSVFFQQSLAYDGQNTLGLGSVASIPLSPRKKSWFDTILTLNWKKIRPKCFMRVDLPDDSRYQDTWAVGFIYIVLHQPIFNFLIHLLIVIDLLFLALDPYPKYSVDLSQAAYYVNFVITGLFCLEAILNLYVLGEKEYLKDKFKIYEGCVAVLGVIDLIVFGISSAAFSVLRAFRLFKIGSLSKNWASFRVLVKVLFINLQLVINFLLLYGIFIVSFATFGKNLFAFRLSGLGLEDEFRSTFDTFRDSVIAILQIVFSENYSNLFLKCINALGARAFLFFVSVACIGRYILHNLFLAMLLYVFEEVRKDQGTRKMQLNGILRTLKRRAVFPKGKSTIKELPEDGFVGLNSIEQEVVESSTAIEVGGVGDVGGNEDNATTKFQGKKSLVSEEISGAKNENKVLRKMLTLKEKRKKELDGPQNQKNILKHTFNDSSRGQLVSMDSGTFASEAQMFVMSGVPQSANALTPEGAVSPFNTPIKNIESTKIKRDWDDGENGWTQKTLEKENSEKREHKEKKKKTILSFSKGSPFRQPTFMKESQFPSALETKTSVQVLFDWKSSKSTQISLKVWNYIRISSVGLFPQETMIRNAFIRVIEHRYWERLIIAIIFFACIVLALDSPMSNPLGTQAKVLRIVDNLFTLVFLFEFVLNVAAYGVFFNANPQKKAYLRNNWNILDAVVLGAGIVDYFADSGGSLASVKSLRALRSLKPLKVVSRNEALRLSVNALFSSIPPLLSLIFTCLIFLVVGGLLGMKFFKGTFYSCSEIDGALLAQVRTKDDCLNSGGKWTNSQKHFDNIFNAVLSLIETSTGEAWVELKNSANNSVGIDMQPIENNRPWASFIIVGFMMFGTIILFNLFIGVAVDNFKMKKQELSGISDLDENQRYWAEMQKIFQRKRIPVKIPVPESDIRLFCLKIVSSHKFEYFIMGCIVLNVIIMAFKFVNQPEELDFCVNILNGVFLGVFHIETALRIMAHGLFYFRDNFNRFDFLIVACSDIFIAISQFSSINSDFETLPTVMRALRIGKLVRIMRGQKYIQIILDTIFLLFSSALNIVALFLLITFIFAVLGLNFFPYVMQQTYINEFQNFQSFWNSMVTLFQCATGENWDLIMEELAFSAEGCLDDQTFEDMMENGVKGCGTFIAYPFFMSFLILVRMIVINLVLAIIIEGYTDFRKEGDAAINQRQVEEFLEKWSDYDPTGTGFISPKDFLFFLHELHPPVGLKKDNPAKYETNFTSNPKFLVSPNKKVIIQKNDDFFKTLSKYNVHLYFYNGDWRVHFSEAASKVSKRVICDSQLCDDIEISSPNIMKSLVMAWMDRYPALKQAKKEERKNRRDLQKKLEEKKRDKEISEEEMRVILEYSPSIRHFFAKSSIWDIIRMQKEKRMIKKNFIIDQKLIGIIKRSKYSSFSPGAMLRKPNYKENRRKWHQRKRELADRMRNQKIEEDKQVSTPKQLQEKVETIFPFPGEEDFENSMEKQKKDYQDKESENFSSFSQAYKGLNYKKRRAATQIWSKNVDQSKGAPKENYIQSPLLKEKHWFDDEKVTISQNPRIQRRIISIKHDFSDLVFVKKKGNSAEKRKDSKSKTHLNKEAEEKEEENSGSFQATSKTPKLVSLSCDLEQSQFTFGKKTESQSQIFPKSARSLNKQEDAEDLIPGNNKGTKSFLQVNRPGLSVSLSGSFEENEAEILESNLNGDDLIGKQMGDEGLRARLDLECIENEKNGDEEGFSEPSSEKTEEKD